MSDFPNQVCIVEEGPREELQRGGVHVPTADKVRLIDALSDTGLPKIQLCALLPPAEAPGCADADLVLECFTPRPGVKYCTYYLDEAGFRRALRFEHKLYLKGAISLSPSELYIRRSRGRTRAENTALMRRLAAIHREENVEIDRITIPAAFGCNARGDICPEQVIAELKEGMSIAAEHEARIVQIVLCDSMGWATPPAVERLVREVRSRWPDQEIRLHLEDTRGLGIANAYEALRAGVTMLDGCIGGIGNSPFVEDARARGNVATEELVHLCHELGIETGIYLDALLDVARMAESIVSRPLPGGLMKAGSLTRFRARR